MSFSQRETDNFSRLVKMYDAGTLDMRKLVNGAPPGGWEVIQSTVSGGKTLWSAKNFHRAQNLTDWRHGIQ